MFMSVSLHWLGAFKSELMKSYDVTHRQGLGLLVWVLGLTISKGIKKTVEIGLDNLD